MTPHCREIATNNKVTDSASFISFRAHSHFGKGGGIRDKGSEMVSLDRATVTFYNSKIYSD